MKEDSKHTMHEAHGRARADVSTLAEWLTSELERRDAGEATWGAVGSLEHLRTGLIEMLAAYSGMPEEDIRRSLEEMDRDL